MEMVDEEVCLLYTNFREVFFTKDEPWLNIKVSAIAILIGKAAWLLASDAKK